MTPFRWRAPLLVVGFVLAGIGAPVRASAPQKLGVGDCTPEVSVLPLEDQAEEDQKAGDKKKDEQISFLDQLVEKKISIRKTFDGTRNEEKPASFLVTSNRDGEDFYSVDLAAKLGHLERGERSTLILFPTIEWHRSTKDEEELNKLSGGLKLEYQVSATREYCPDGRLRSEEEREKKTASLFVLAGADLIRDEEKDDTTLKGSVLLSLISNKRWYPGSDIRDRGQVLRFRYYPYVGVESFDPLSKDLDESLRVATGRLYLELWPVATLDRRYLQLVVTYSYRQRIGGLEDLGDDFDDLSVALNWYLDDKERFALGYEYQRGEDPDAAFAFREISVLGFKLKL